MAPFPGRPKRPPSATAARRGGRPSTHGCDAAEPSPANNHISAGSYHRSLIFLTSYGEVRVGLSFKAVSDHPLLCVPRTIKRKPIEDRTLRIVANSGLPLVANDR